jgi:acetoin utilization deacetylase AcuC-like enzyme
MVPFGAGAFEIACLAAGGVMTAVDAVLDGDVDNCYALVRPPGHHAEASRGRGFCIFANVALAVLHARAARGVDRVAVVDWDVHHGNGTQDAFYAHPDVLTISIHGDNHYPQGRGGVEENGTGAGAGACINVPLPHGSGVGAYVAAFERVVLPALRTFAPDLIIVASGLDANALDPLGRQMLHSDGYRRLTTLMLQVASEVADGRLVLAHEGGYSAGYVPFCGLAIVETLAGVRTPVEDPFLEQLAAMGGQDLQPHQDEAIARSEVLLDRVPGVGSHA